MTSNSCIPFISKNFHIIYNNFNMPLPKISLVLLLLTLFSVAQCVTMQHKQRYIITSLVHGVDNNRFYFDIDFKNQVITLYGCMKHVIQYAWLFKDSRTKRYPVQRFSHQFGSNCPGDQYLIEQIRSTAYVVQTQKGLTFYRNDGGMVFRAQKIKPMKKYIIDSSQYMDQQTFKNFSFTIGDTTQFCGIEFSGCDEHFIRCLNNEGDIQRLFSRRMTYHDECFMSSDQDILDLFKYDVKTQVNKPGRIQFYGISGQLVLGLKQV